VIRILHGDCLDVLPTLEAASFDAVVTDPPYHLTSIVERFGKPGSAPAKHGTDGAFARASKGFMGKEWDGGSIAFQPETWAQVYRVLKPGGHMVCFGGTRTAHRMTCAIEDAGFEIRDTLCWLYGTGFPKSLDIGKAIDKAAGTNGKAVAIGAEVRRMIPGADQAVDGWIKDNGRTYQPHDYIPATPEAAQWQGWGSALKPAHEPIVLARKPLDNCTIAANVLKHGVGGINIDACRIESEKSTGWSGRTAEAGDLTNYRMGKPGDARPVDGRFPANVLHDGSDEVMAAFAAFPTHSAGHAQGKQDKWADQDKAPGWGNIGLGPNGHRFGDTGTAARFFFSAKANKADRADSKHPTVKPLALMEWLVKLITPPGGEVLDPFAGSGITAEACMKLGVDCTLIDIDAANVRDIRHRIKRWSGLDSPLFAGTAS
jgi:DNA modification methylase